MRISSAKFSGCKKYRYELRRQWAGPKNYCMFLMLNPSTADENKNDPTVQRCEIYAKDWGYGGLYVGNIFAWRATDRAVMKSQPEPIGKDNDKHIITMAKRSEIVVCAWGNDGDHMNRSSQVLKLLSDNDIKPHCLKITNPGEPWHPLYLRKDLKPKKYIAAKQ